MRHSGALLDWRCSAGKALLIVVVVIVCMPGWHQSDFQSWGASHDISCSHEQTSQPAGLEDAGSLDMKQAATCVTLRQSEYGSDRHASKGSALLLLLVLLLPLGDGELPLLATGTRLPESGELLPLLSGLGLLLPAVFALFVFEAPARYCPWS